MNISFSVLLKKIFPYAMGLIIGLLLVIVCIGSIDRRQEETETAEEETAVSFTETAVPETTVPPTDPPTAPPTDPPTDPPTEPPESVRLEVPYYSQKSVLPTGCELVSAKMVLEYYTGSEVAVSDIVDHTRCQYTQQISGRTCGLHPSQSFIGSPWDSTSFGCFAPVVVDMMNALLPEGYTAVDTSGTSLPELAETYLPQGKPVLVWVTICMVETHPGIGWYLLDDDGQPTDTWYAWPANEHCMVLCGYDKDYYYFNDPYGGYGFVAYKRALSEQRYEDIGMYSVVVEEAAPDA